MLWRASQFFGHLHRAALQFTGRGPFSSPLLQTSQHIRWMSAALALQARAIFIVPGALADKSRLRQDPREPATTSHVPPKQEKKHPKPLMHALRSLPQPNAGLVRAVDVLFKQRIEEECTVEELKSQAKSSGLLAHLEDSEKARHLAALMVNTGIPQRANRVLLLAHGFGCKFKQNAYEGVAYQLAQTGQWSAVPSLIDLGRRQTGRTTARLLNWRARALVEISHFGLLDRVLEDFETENISPNRRTFHVLVEGHLRNRDLAKVKECLDWMEGAGFPMDASTHALLVNNYRTLGPDPAIKEQAFSSLQDMGARNSTLVLNSLIQLSLDTRDIDGALKYLSHFDGPPVALATVSEDDIPTGDNKLPVPISDRPGPGKPALLPDIATFTMLTNYAARTLDLPLAMQMVERMKSYGVHPDDTYVASLIRAYCAVGDISSALRITAQTCKHLPRAVQLLRKLGPDSVETGGSDPVISGIDLSIWCLNALLRGVLQQQGLHGLRIMYRLMNTLGFDPNEETVQVVMSYLSRTEKAHPGELIQVLKRLPGNSRPTLRQVHVILQSLLGKEREKAIPRGWASTAEAAQTPPEEGQTTSSGSENIPPTSLDRLARSILTGRSSYRALIRPLIASLSTRRVRIDRATVHLAMRHDALVARNMERAKETLRGMLARGMHPNEYHFAATMEGYAISGDMRSAEKVLAIAQEAGFGRDPVLYTILIHGYARKGWPSEATRVFQQMMSRGVEPDVGAVDALASAFFAVRSYSASRRVLLQFWERFAPFPPELQDAKLDTLAEEFRKLDKRPVFRSTKQSRRMLQWKIKRIFQNRRKRQQRRAGQGRRSRRGRGVMHSTSYNKQSKLH